MMGLQNNSLPSAYNNLDRYTTELLIRSYAAPWIYIKWWVYDPSLFATVYLHFRRNTGHKLVEIVEK